MFWKMWSKVRQREQNQACELAIPLLVQNEDSNEALGRAIPFVADSKVFSTSKVSRAYMDEMRNILIKTNHSVSLRLTRRTY